MCGEKRPVPRGTLALLQYYPFPIEKKIKKKTFIQKIKAALKKKLGEEPPPDKRKESSNSLSLSQSHTELAMRKSEQWLRLGALYLP